MLSKSNFSRRHIDELHRRYPKVTESVFEMSMYAFGLLELLADSRLDFIFKGGTSLMLLLKEPKRVSTDIDILVPPHTDMAPVIASIQHEYPLLDLSKDKLQSQNGRSVGHWVFECPHLYGTSAHVCLDVVYGDNPYPCVEERPITNSFLLIDGLPRMVKVPSIESLLGDKLTAFAPHTIGVHPDMTTFGTPFDKRLQIIKQLYDINALLSEAKDFSAIRSSYFAIAGQEAVLHGLSAHSPKDFLGDTFRSALSIATLGFGDEHAEYREVFAPGITKLVDHVFAFDWTVSKAQECAVNVMLLSACLLQDEDIFHLKIQHRPGYHQKPYSYLNRTLLIPGEFDKAIQAIGIFDPKAC